MVIKVIDNNTDVINFSKEKLRAINQIFIEQYLQDE